MSNDTTDTQTTNEEIKPTKDELINYIFAIGHLISYTAVKIKGY